MATGTQTVNFGAFPGGAYASADVASAGLVSTSLVEAWVRLEATADHSIDEHRVEDFDVYAEFLSAGNLRIHALPKVGRAYGIYNMNFAWA